MKKIITLFLFCLFAMSAIGQTSNFNFTVHVPRATTPTLTNGLIWYDSGTGKFKARQAGSTVDLIASGTVTGSGTTNELAYWTSSTALGSLTTATYPSLTELSYVKGVTSGIQAQINALSGGSGFWSTATGGTATGTNTFAFGSNPWIITSGVTTGTGATAGIQGVFNSLTTGNGLDFGTTSGTSGTVAKFANTGTAALTGSKAIYGLQSGTNGTGSQTTYTGYFENIRTGGGNNYGGYFAASGGAINYALQAVGSSLFQPGTGSVFVSGGTGTDAISVSGANAGRISIVVENTNSSGNASFYFQNNRGGFAAYGGLLTSGSATPGTFFGVTKFDYTALISDGASSAGLMIGTLTAKPLILGTSDATALTINSSRNILIAGSGIAFTANTKFEIVGIGTTTANIIRLANSASTERMASTDQGNTSWTQAGITTGSPTMQLFTGGAHTTLTASTEATDINFNLARTVQFSTGALTTQRAFRIQAPTYGFVGASTITTASTLSISGAPVAGTNATITNSFALNLEAGAIGLAGSAGTSGQVLTSAGAGATPTWTTVSGSISGLTTNKIPYASSSTTIADMELEYENGGGLTILKHTTSDGSDTRAIVIGNSSNTRSGRINLYGNEFTGQEGNVVVAHGNPTGSKIQIGSATGLFVSNDNVGIGTSTWGTSAAEVLAISNGTPPSTSPADQIQLYAEDVAASSELKVRDEAGNITTLSPHNFSLIGKPSEAGAWSHYSEYTNPETGKREAVNIDMLKLARLIEKLTGEKLVYKTILK